MFIIYRNDFRLVFYFRNCHNDFLFKIAVFHTVWEIDSFIPISIKFLDFECGFDFQTYLKRRSPGEDGKFKTDGRSEKQGRIRHARDCHIYFERVYFAEHNEHIW